MFPDYPSPDLTDRGRTGLIFISRSRRGINERVNDWHCSSENPQARGENNGTRAPASDSLIAALAALTFLASRLVRAFMRRIAR